MGFFSAMKEKLDSLGYPIGRGRQDLDMGAFLNVRLIRTATKLALLFQRQALRPNGLTVQDWRVIVNLAKIGDCHLRELSRYSSIDPSHVSRGTKALETRGLIRRYADPKDGRRTRLCLTDAGMDLVDCIWPKALELNDQIATSIGQAQLSDVCKVLDEIRHTVELQLDDAS